MLSGYLQSTLLDAGPHILKIHNSANQSFHKLRLQLRYPSQDQVSATTNHSHLPWWYYHNFQKESHNEVPKTVFQHIIEMWISNFGVKSLSQTRLEFRL